MPFEQFPYTNFHELNLDWIIGKLKDVQNEIDSVIGDAEAAAAEAKQNADESLINAQTAQTAAGNAQAYASQAYDASIGLIDDVDALSARMDTFTALAEGSTTGDAELADIRVEYDGVTANTAGDAVRQQVSDLWDASLRLYTSTTSIQTQYSNTLANINENVIFPANSSWLDLPVNAANVAVTGGFINLRYANAYNINLLFDTAGGLMFKRIITRSSHAVLLDWQPVGVQGTNVNINGANVADVCNSDFNNLGNNMIYGVSITAADAATVSNLPTGHRLCRGLLLTFGKRYQHTSTDAQVFIAQYGQWMAWRTFWSDWTEWNYVGVKPFKILCVGDSIAYGSRNNHYGFLGDLHVTVTNDSVIGSSVSTVKPQVNIPTQLINRAATDTDFDVVIADGGANDYVGGASLGTIPEHPINNDADDALLDLSTLCGGLQHLFYNMIKLYPMSKRFFVITHRTKQWPWLSGAGGFNQTQMHDAIVTIAAMYGVKVIDIFNNSPMNTAFNEYVSPTPYSDDPTVTDLYYCDADGIHPLALGYKQGYVPFIKEALNTATIL